MTGCWNYIQKEKRRDRTLEGLNKALKGLIASGPPPHSKGNRNLGGIWDHLNYWGHLCVSWGLLGGILVYLGAILGHLGAILGYSGAILKPS